MARKRNNPLKLGKGEYQFYPEEVELMGKIPDRIIARIFDTKTMLIRQGRLERKIPASGVKDRKKIFDVLQSLNVPKSYYKAAGLADLLQVSLPKHSPIRIKQVAKSKYCSYIACPEGQKGKRGIVSSGSDYCSLECKLSDEAYFKQPGTKTKRLPKFHVESRSLTSTPTRMPYQGYPITKPLKNPYPGFKQDAYDLAKFYAFIGTALGLSVFAVLGMRLLNPNKSK